MARCPSNPGADLRGAARRAVRAAPAGRGDHRAARGCARHERVGRAPAPRRASRRTGSCRRRRCHASPRAAGPAAARAPSSPPSPSRCSRRRTASSPTSCSATSRPRTSPRHSSTGATSAHRGPGPARHQADVRGAGGGARDHPRRGRLSRVVRASRARPLPGVEHNCAVLAVAQQHPHACSSEIEFIRAALADATVERTTHIVAGAHACTYEIRKRPDAYLSQALLAIAPCGVAS